MKKLIILLVCIVSFIAIQAQENAIEDAYLDYNETWWQDFNFGNVTSATDSIWYYTVHKESLSPLKYDVKLIMDSISGTSDAVNVYLQKKKFLSDDFANLDTVSWNLGSDTTIYFTVTTDTSYMDRWFRIYTICDTSGFIYQVDELSFKFWE